MQSKTTKDITLSETYVLQIIDKSRKILETDDCYPSEIRNVFSKASDFVPSASFIVESQKLYKVLYNSGDAEKFYTNFFTIMPLKAEEFFQNINKNAAVLLVLKFADSLITFEKKRVACKSSDKANSPEPSKISDNEKSALQYLGGYVLHNLHKKIRASKNIIVKRTSKPCHF